MLYLFCFFHFPSMIRYLWISFLTIIQFVYGSQNVKIRGSQTNTHTHILKIIIKRTHTLCVYVCTCRDANVCILLLLKQCVQKRRCSKYFRFYTIFRFLLDLFVHIYFNFTRYTT